MYVCARRGGQGYVKCDTLHHGGEMMLADAVRPSLTRYILRADDGEGGVLGQRVVCAGDAGARYHRRSEDLAQLMAGVLLVVLREIKAGRCREGRLSRAWSDNHDSIQ